MQALIDGAGKFRTSIIGVFGEKGCVHIAPPAERVQALMSELFKQLKSFTDHLLVPLCVFHFEFKFIHPFSDGNGRMGRLWQSLILGKLHPSFEHLPVENMVYANQQAYHDAIAEGNKKGNCAPFIDFMLQEILNFLKYIKGTERGNVRINVEINEQKILNLIANSPKVTVKIWQKHWA